MYKNIVKSKQCLVKPKKYIYVKDKYTIYILIV